jgi:hypothetical protein
MRTQSLFIKRMTALSLALLFVIASSVTQVQAAPAPDLTSQQIEAVLEDAICRTSCVRRSAGRKQFRL